MSWPPDGKTFEEIFQNPPFYVVFPIDKCRRADQMHRDVMRPVVEDDLESLSTAIREIRVFPRVSGRRTAEERTKVLR